MRTLVTTALLLASGCKAPALGVPTSVESEPFHAIEEPPAFRKDGGRSWCSGFGRVVARIDSSSAHGPAILFVGGSPDGRCFVFSTIDGSLLREFSGGSGFLTIDVLEDAGRVSLLLGNLQYGLEDQSWSLPHLRKLSATDLAEAWIIGWRPEGFSPGFSVIGDIDGDGIDDFAGSRNANATEQRYSTQLSLLSGRNGNPLRLLDNGESDWLFANAVSCAIDDIDGDGLEDVASILHTRFATAHRCVALYSSSTGRRLHTSTALERSFLGFDLERVGDRNGDGVRDLACSDQNSVFLFSGCDASTLGELRSGMPGSGLSNGFGATLASLGDVNQDEIEDFVVGQCDGWRYPSDFYYWRAFSGATGSGLFAGTRWTCSHVFAVDDVSGDEVPDFAVGFPTEELVELRSGVDGGLLFTLRPGD